MGPPARRTISLSDSILQTLFTAGRVTCEASVTGAAEADTAGAVDWVSWGADDGAAITATVMPAPSTRPAERTRLNRIVMPLSGSKVSIRSISKLFVAPISLHMIPH